MGYQKKIMEDLGGNFISDKFKTFCKRLNIEQVFLLSYHHQNNGQIETGIKFVKHTLKKCFDSRSDLHIALLQTCMTPLGQGLPSPVTMLFNSMITEILPVIIRPPVGIDNRKKANNKQKIIKAEIHQKCMFLSP